MKILEQILLDSNNHNNPKTIVDIHAQLDYYAKNNMQVEGISLMSIRDKLHPTYTDEILRRNGYILTIADFKEDCQKFFELADKNPILYNSRLKRLHRSYQVLMESYTKGTVSNKAVAAEISKKLADTLLINYWQGSDEYKTMPTELRARIMSMFDVEVENLHKNWCTNKLGSDNKNELTDAVCSKLVDDCQNKRLPQIIYKQFEDEKSKINSVAALLSQFQERKLPQETQDIIKSATVEQIKNEIDANKLVTSSALGDYYNNVYNSSIDKSHFKTASQIINNWQNKQVTTDVAIELEKHICDVLNRMKQNLENNLTQQFEQYAIQIMLEKMHTGYYKGEIVESLQKYSLAIAKQYLLSNKQAELDRLPKCKSTIYTELMTQLHMSWLSGKLSQVENEFIKESVFAELHELDEKIQEKVWPNKNKRYVEQLIRENAEMRNKLSHVEKLLEQLISQKQGNIKTAVTGALAVPIVDETPAIPSSRMGFFGNK